MVKDGKPVENERDNSVFSRLSSIKEKKKLQNLKKIIRNLETRKKH